MDEKIVWWKAYDEIRLENLSSKNEKPIYFS